MPGRVEFDGPAPPLGGLLFCAVHAGIAKHGAYQPVKEQVEAHLRGHGTRRWKLGIQDGSVPVAVAWGLYPPVGAMLPLCWSCLAMIDVRGSAIIPANGALPSGPVHLDQRRPPG